NIAMAGEPPAHPAPPGGDSGAFLVGPGSRADTAELPRSGDPRSLAGVGGRAAGGYERDPFPAPSHRCASPAATAVSSFEVGPAGISCTCSPSRDGIYYEIVDPRNDGSGWNKVMAGETPANPATPAGLFTHVPCKSRFGCRHG